MNRKERGVTLITLAITVVVLSIIAGIAVYSGSETVRKAKLEELRTNMLLIEAKAKGLVEEANFQLGPNSQKEGELDTTIRPEIYTTNNKLQVVTSSPITLDGKNIEVPSAIPTGNNVYALTNETYSIWGIEDIKLEDNEAYIVSFNEKEATVEVYNTLGYNGKYSLTEIDSIEE